MIIISEIMIFTGVAKECFIECDETLISEQGTPAAWLIAFGGWDRLPELSNQQLDMVNTS